MILPSHGAVLGTFHLAHSLRHGSVRDPESWVRKAAEKGSFASAAIDHKPLADLLLESPLVHAGREIVADDRLLTLTYRANRSTLIAIATLLLEISPPPWLPIAVRDGTVMHEFIPDDDLRALDWLRPELDILLGDASRRSGAHDASLHLGLGRAAELVVLEILDSLGHGPVHVADVSDSFGYDIETAVGPIRRWEVKASVESTSGRFHLSRNEFDKSQLHSADWVVIQIEFASRVFAGLSIDESDIKSLRMIDSGTLARLIPADSCYFSWAREAIITPASSDWIESGLSVPESLSLPSISLLAEKAASVRASHRS